MRYLKDNALAIAIVIALVFAVVDARRLHSDGERDSFARVVDTCNRGNPSRAYLQLRAIEFPKSVVTGKSYTTEVAPDVYQLLDCEKTVAAHHPVALSREAAATYLGYFQVRRVPVVKDGRVVDTIPFSKYFKH